MVLALAACGKKPSEATEEPSQATETSSETSSSQSQTEPSDIDAPEGAVTDETKLGEAVTYYTDGEYLYLKIKTSYEFDAHNAYIDIVNPSFYLTRDSEFITQSIFGSGRDFDEEFDKEWFDGIYVFKLDNNMITGLASDESEWAPGSLSTWTLIRQFGQWLR